MPADVTPNGRCHGRLCPENSGADPRAEVDGEDAVVRCETGEETGQESRSAVTEPRLA